MEAQNCGKTTWILHHDNAPDHTSMLVREFLSKNKTLIMSQRIHRTWPLFTFSSSQTPMKGKRFATFDEIKEKLKEKLLKIPESAFQKCLEVGNNSGIIVLYLRAATWKRTI